MPQPRLTHEVELQAQQLRQLLAEHHVDAELVQGTVQENGHGRHTTFSVRAKLAAGWQQAQALARDLQQTWGQEVAVADDEATGGMKISLFQKSRPPVELLDLLELLPDVPPLTAVLGWTANDRAIWLDFTQADTTHILLAGQEGAGKTSLLRTIALSLALNNRERELQLAIISVSPDERPLRQRQALQPLEYLPHMLCPIATEAAEALKLVQFLGQEARYRQEAGIIRPHIVLLVDHLEELLGWGGHTAVADLTHLIRQGPAAGIHLVLSMGELTTTLLPPLEDLLDANLPARLVGQLPNAAQAEIATDVYDSGAELLRGQGDFIAVLGEMMVHFQAAFISDYDLHLCLEHLYAHRPPVLLAQPFDPRPRPPREPAATSYQFHFAPTPPPVVPASRPVQRISHQSQPIQPVAPVPEVKPEVVPESEVETIAEVVDEGIIATAVSEEFAEEISEAIVAEMPERVAQMKRKAIVPRVRPRVRRAEPAKAVQPEKNGGVPSAEPPPPAPAPPILNAPPPTSLPPLPEPSPYPADEIPFDWLPVPPLAEVELVEKLPEVVVEVVAEKESVPPPVVAPPVIAEMEAAVLEEGREANTAVQNLLQWHKRLPNLPTPPPKRVTRVNPPTTPITPVTPVVMQDETDSPALTPEEQFVLEVEGKVPVKAKTETEAEAEATELDEMLADLGGTAPLAWLDELDELGEGDELDEWADELLEE